MIHSGPKHAREQGAKPRKRGAKPRKQGAKPRKKAQIWISALKNLWPHRKIQWEVAKKKYLMCAQKELF